MTVEGPGASGVGVQFNGATLARVQVDCRAPSARKPAARGLVMKVGLGRAGATSLRHAPEDVVSRAVHMAADRTLGQYRARCRQGAEDEEAEDEEA